MVHTSKELDQSHRKATHADQSIHCVHIHAPINVFPESGSCRIINNGELDNFERLGYKSPPMCKYVIRWCPKSLGRRPGLGDLAIAKHYNFDHIIALRKHFCFTNN